MYEETADIAKQRQLVADYFKIAAPNGKKTVHDTFHPMMTSIEDNFSSYYNKIGKAPIVRRLSFDEMLLGGDYIGCYYKTNMTPILIEFP